LAIAQIDINGNPYIGIFCAVNENLAIVPIDLEKKLRQKLEDILEIEVLPTLISSSRLIGSLLVLNSNGVIVNNFAETSEIARLKKYLNIMVLDDKLNAVGNNILTNDHAALVHTQYHREIIKQIEDTLDVEVLKGTIAGTRTVGTSAVMTNKGGLCHPKIKADELEKLQDIFKIDIVTGTANYGTPLIGACLIANSKGAVTGTTTTGIELGRIEEGFNLI
jgi:translation initiation factor 6